VDKIDQIRRHKFQYYFVDFFSACSQRRMCNKRFERRRRTTKKETKNGCRKERQSIIEVRRKSFVM